jgi:hypothetical protein
VTSTDNESNRRRINKSPMALEDPEKAALKKFLTTPPVKKIDLHFPLGLEVTARNLKGVTIKDALDAIYKQYRKKVRSCIPCYYLRPRFVAEVQHSLLNHYRSISEEPQLTYANTGR